jgi:hypothetical protein
MTIEVECGGCGRRLEVDEQFAGQTAACPLCHARFEIPMPAVAEGAAAEPVTWSMKTPEGRIYGPVAKSELDQWVSEGRVSLDCGLREMDDEAWRPADETDPVLLPGAGIAPARGNPFAPAPFYVTQAGVPVSVRAEPATARPAYLAPHRGGLILALGVLSFLTTFLMACPVLSFLAWTMGTRDLREMREGRMDPSGMGMTQAGMVLGMLLSVFTVIIMMALVFYLIFQVAM